jgi:hypothetical protein
MACGGCLQRKAVILAVARAVLRTPAAALARIRDRLAAAKER